MPEMKTKYLKLLMGISVSVFCFGITLAQTPDFSLARVDKRIYGVYIFLGCEPANTYTYIKTIDVSIDRTDSYYVALGKIIEKAKKKEPNFNGMILKTEDLSKADLIRFDDLLSSRGGYYYGSKVSFVENGKVFAAEVVEPESSRGVSTVKFNNIYNEQEIRKIDHKDLTPITSELFTTSQKETEISAEKYKFEIGEKVSWIEENKIGKKKQHLTGEVVKLDSKEHKALVKHVNSKNKETISTIPFLDLIKTK